MKLIELKRNRVLLAMLVTVPLLLPACAPAEQGTAPASGPAGHTAPAESEGVTCAAHGAPKELCFICDASLREKGRLWCREHARYEDRCWLCHPELEDADRLWCKEHSLYEDECFLCHPELLEDGSAPGEKRPGPSASNPSAGSGLWCNEHGVPEAECGICHPELLAQDPAPAGLKVRLASETSAERAGVVVRIPEVRHMDDGVDCFAELTFDQNKLARIPSLVTGVVKSVEVDLGSRVERGDLLATIASETIGEAQAAYLRALAEEALRGKTFERERDLLAQNVSSRREFQEAQAAHQASAAAARQARQRLRVLGFDGSQIEALAGEEGMPGILELRAPFGGEIVERSAVRGSVVDASHMLFTLADTSVLWAMANIPESHVSRVHPGQDVVLTVESLPGRTFSGTLTWVSATVDKRTRMVQGRVEVANQDRRLKAQMFGHARISTTHSDNAVVVPRSAVQDVSGTPIVFVRTSDDLFEARPVTVGIELEGGVEIVAGLEPDEPVVVDGGYALKSQLLVSRLGAGCAHE